MLKEGVDKIDVGKLEIVPADLSKLNNVVDNDVVKKSVLKKLVNKFNAIDTKEYDLKTQ